MPEAHTIPVTPEESIAAVYHPADTDRWLICCHGFLSDKSGSYEYRCERAVEEGFHAVRFDFRGCGDSDGAFDDQNLTSRIADLRAVIDHFDPTSYVLFGSSFGGKTVFHAAAGDERIDAIVVRAPVTYNRAFDEYRRLVAEEGVLRFDDARAIDERFLEDFDRYPFADVETALDVPVAMFHGGEDNSVPSEHSFEAAEALETDVLVQKYAAEGHRFSRAAEDRMLQTAFDWLSNT